MFILVFIGLFCFICYVYKYYYVPSCPNVPSIPDLLKTGLIILKCDLRDLFNLIINIGIFTNKSNGVSKARLGPILIYFISNAEDASIVLSQCLEKMFVYDFIAPYVGKEMVAANAEVFKKNRRVLEPAFKPNILNAFIDVFNEQATRFVEKLSKKSDIGYVDIVPDITRVTLEAVCQTSMGLNINGEDLASNQYVDEVHKVLDTLTTRFQKPWLIPDFIYKYSSLKKEQDEALNVVWKLSADMVAQRKSEHLNRLKKNEPFNYEERKFKSFIEIILENSITEDEVRYTDIQLRHIVDNLLLAGFDTSSFEFLYTLICLGTYPDIQEKVYQEIKEVIGDRERIDKDDLLELKYLDAVLKETLRLYPIGPVIARQADRDVQLRDNKTISKGSSIVVHVWSLNRNPLYWGPDAEEFRPERWLSSDTLPQHPAAFATFVPGRRTCTGKAYAMTFIKILLARTCQNYRFTADCSKLEFRADIMLKPIGGYFVKCYKR
ncbi:cytochrome P450 4V2-like [Epargyreus clarus]|uniref:cytochrome P450 4V2-like n=1 Tax=Epargyreus clarus TaxID=520877 RepID=UPI003C2D4FFC